MIVEENRDLPVAAPVVAAFLEALDRNYLAWHPDHIAFEWLDGERRTRFRFVETIGRWRLAMTMSVERSADGLTAICRPSSAFARLVMPWMSFAAEPRGMGSRYVHRIKLRLGPLAMVLGKSFLGPLRRHMAEESDYLARLT